MKAVYSFLVLMVSILSLLTGCGEANRDRAPGKSILVRNATLIDGNGGAPVEHADLLIQGDTIAAVGQNLDSTGSTVIDASGKTIMPSLISAHVHVGTLKGTGTAVENYTRQNILSQLKKYEDFGVLQVQSMGTDRSLLFANRFFDSLKAGYLPGARMHSAGRGFGVLNGAPATGGIMDLLFRPIVPADVPAEIDTLKKLQPDVVKIWVDDFGGQYKKMDTAVYKAIITEAHKRDLRVAAHLWYLADARRLVAYGLDIIAHSIRDSVVDDAFVQEMKARNVLYIPTLSLDEFAYIYARKPEWLGDPFFKASLEPGVFEMITSEKYRADLENSPAYKRSQAAFETALKNLAKLYAAGVLICLGTDSGATPVRAQGFSEHLEMELMVQAGLTPLQAITVATKNAARLLKINDQYGALEKGKTADLIILGENPAANIKNTRKIEAVYKSGRLVSKGPLQ